MLSWLKENPDINEKEVKEIFQRICQTVGKIHDLGIVHRDIKLENILIDAESKIPFVIDFGLSKVLLLE